MLALRTCVVATPTYCPYALRSLQKPILESTKREKTANACPAIGTKHSGDSKTGVS